MKQYSKFLKPLLEEPGSKYKHVKYDWQEFSSYEKIMRTDLNLPPLDPGDPRRRLPNNELLVTACIGHYRVRKGRGFSSIARQLAIWLTKSVINNELFHSRGPVRILFWLADEEKNAILPRNINTREKAAICMERLVDIYEIAGAGDEYRKAGPRNNMRDPEFMLQSAEIVAARMATAGLDMPLQRRPNSHQLALNSLSARADGSPEQISEARNAALESLAAGTRIESIRPEFLELNQQRDEGKLQCIDASGKQSELFKRWRLLSNSIYRNKRSKAKLGPLIELNEKINHLERVISDPSSSQEEVDSAKSKWEALCKDYHTGIANLPNGASAGSLFDYTNARQGLEVESPLLMWDRRKFEPLLVKEDEFMLRKEMSLLDIQPKPITSDNAPSEQEYFEDFLRPLFSSGWHIPVKKALEGISPGLSSSLIDAAPTLKNPSKGGRLDLDDMRVGVLTIEMIEELVKAWKESPWRPPGSDSQRYFRNKSGGVQSIA